MDNALSLSAARTKGLHSLVAGRADILVAPNLEAGNIFAKELTYVAQAEGAGLVIGAKAPILLTSRADDERSRLFSCAVATLYAHWLATGESARPLGRSEGSCGMSRHIVTLNAGSSSIKFALFSTENTELSLIAVGLAEMAGDQRRLKVRNGDDATVHEEFWAPQTKARFHNEALRRIFQWQDDVFPTVDVIAVGHRVVHGGVHYAAPVLVTDDVITNLERLIPLAPLHRTPQHRWDRRGARGLA